jgi:sortase A
MKGRRLRSSHHTSGARAAVFVAGLALVAPLASCGGDDAGALAAAGLPGEDSAVSAVVPATEDDPIVRPPTTTAAPSTTAAPTTEPVVPATTSAPTVVATLPTPLPPPEPRAEEPYVELGRIQIPKIGVDTVLLQGITLTTLDLGPGHWPGTALPGQIGNSVIAGHRTSHNKVFRDVDQLVAGDEVIFATAEGTYTYVVRETTIVKPDAMYIIDQTWEPTATLFACHPPGSTRERIVVHLDLQGEPAPPSV